MCISRTATSLTASCLGSSKPKPASSKWKPLNLRHPNRIFGYLESHRCHIFSHPPWILPEVGPQAHCDVSVFDHGLHVARLRVDALVGVLRREKKKPPTVPHVLINAANKRENAKFAAP